MLMQRILLAIILLEGWFDGGFAYAEALRDPRLRDEDLSYSTVSVHVVQRQDGFYEYTYDIVNPAENRGAIADFMMDVSCDLDFGQITFPEPRYPFDRGSFSDPSQHVPVQPYGVTGSTTIQSVTVFNWVSWGMNMGPGRTAKGLRLLSPAPPGPRAYKLVPSVDIEGWDYASYGEDDPTVPWIEDWTVTGTITGPACALAPPDEPVRFPGTANGPSTDNELLTYSEPLRDRWHAGPEAKEVTFTIHYSALIDPKTFHVEPGWARGQFHPQPGGTETVTLPLKQAVNKFQLQVQAQTERGPKAKDEHGAPLADHDVFEIRRDVAAPGRAAPPAGQRRPGREG